jgi:hypothetical protein
MLWGLDVGDGAVLGDEGLDDLLLGLPLREVLVDFLHLGDRGVAGAGKGAARMAQPPALMSQPLQRHLMCMPISLACCDCAETRTVDRGETASASRMTMHRSEPDLIMALSKGGRRRKSRGRRRNDCFRLRRPCQNKRSATTGHQRE